MEQKRAPPFPDEAIFASKWLPKRNEAGHGELSVSFKGEGFKITLSPTECET
jgi:hypothetical protein